MRIKTVFTLSWERCDRHSLGISCIPAVKAQTAGLLTRLWQRHTTQQQLYSWKSQSWDSDSSSPQWELCRGTVELLYEAASPHTSHLDTLTMFLHMDTEKRMIVVEYLFLINGDRANLLFRPFDKAIFILDWSHMLTHQPRQRGINMHAQRLVLYQSQQISLLHY